MAEGGLHVLLDQNVPREIVQWLQGQRPEWRVSHVVNVGLKGKPDQEVFAWAQQNRAIVLTFDEDFADLRMFPLGQHCGVIRLRVWPTNIEEAQSALARLLESVPDEDLVGSLVIVDNYRIRVRKPPGQ